MTESRAGRLSLDDLCDLPARRLEALFRSGRATAIPAGRAEGIALFLPGSAASRPLARLVRLLAWQGKVFEPGKGQLVNRVLPFRIPAFRARVEEGESLLDGRPCLVVDYAPHSPLIAGIRDELREIRPGLYLGMAYWRGFRLFAFALEI